MLFDYIGSGVLANEKIVRLTEMTELLVSNLTSWGAEEFGFENLLETTSAFLIPVNFTPLRVAKYITTLLLEKKLDNASQSSREHKYTPVCY